MFTSPPAVVTFYGRQSEYSGYGSLRFGYLMKSFDGNYLLLYPYESLYHSYRFFVYAVTVSGYLSAGDAMM